MSDTFGAWHLESLIAVGGLGEVWRARRHEITAALKRLHTHLARNDEGLRQFAVEQLLATTLPRHPNVVHGLEASEVGERPYVAYELIDGEDLRRSLIGGTRIAPHKAVSLISAACDGASHLHSEGWVHGDICPANLLLERTTDRVVLVDLGVARGIGEAGAVRGTHAYMAPEQVKGEAWTPATDVFALGIVLWELVANARLFHRGPSWLSMAAVVEAPVPPLQDATLDAIVQRALVKDPQRRTASAEALAAELAAVAS